MSFSWVGPTLSIRVVSQQLLLPKSTIQIQWLISAFPQFECEETLTGMASPQASIDLLHDHVINTMEQSELGTETQDSPSYTIQELQQAMGSLLQARKQHCSVLGRHCADTQKVPKPQWTGALELFSFPRELRDKIYFFYLYRPSGFLWSRCTKRSFPFEDHDNDVTRLFLTSQQVYVEAFAVFCRNSTIRLEGTRYDYTKRLHGLLRLFPDKPARMLHCISNGYWTRNTSHDHSDPGPVFLSILRDAYDLKEHFPKLRVFKVRFGSHFWFEGGGLVVDRNWSNEEKTEWILNWMKNVVKNSDVVPAPWIHWQLVGAWKESSCEDDQETPMNWAYKALVQEFKRNE